MAIWKPKGLEHHREKLKEAQKSSEAKPHIKALADKGTDEALGLMVQGLDNACATEWAEDVANALREHGERGVKALVDHGLKGKGGTLAYNTLRVLRYVRTKEAVEAIAQHALKSEKLDIGVIGAQQLFDIGETEQLLRHGLTSPVDEVAEQSICFVKDLCIEEEHVPLIAEHGLTHRNRMVRVTSAELLGRCAETLGKPATKEAVEPLIKSLKDEDAQVAKASAWALGEIGDDRALHPLMELVNHEDEALRKTVREALRKVQRANL
jgi:hypothetical protein